MAYEIIGTIYQIGATETIPTKNGGSFQKRQLVLIQRRFDNSGQEYQPNYPTLEFANANCPKLDGFKAGDRVRVKFDINGTKTEKNGKDSFFSQLRAFNIEYYVTQSQQPAQAQAYPPQYPPQGYQQAPPQFQQAPSQFQQAPQYQQPQQPFTQIDPQTGLPF